MIVEFYKKNIERYRTPHNKSTDGKIKSISKELLFKINTSKIPEQGEIVNLQGTKYVVETIIRMIDYLPETKEPDTEYFLVEVIPYNGYSTYQHGSSSWGETIPLVCDIE